jgi:NAD(P)-dependent dehydrogenase (short-subunit alcohol dehydrogenase family)
MPPPRQQHRQHGLGRRRRRDPGPLAYCTTKFAVVGLTKSMALDHAASGVT